MPTMNNWTAAAVLAAAAGAAAAQPAAPVTATGAWARASVQGQRASGAFVTLTAQEPLTLVGAASPAAGVTEIHEMKMDGDVMRMRPIDRIELPAGKPVELKPGGLHVMLQELKAPLAAQSSVPLVLTFRTAKGEQRQLSLQVPVSSQPPQGGGHGHAGGHGQGHRN